MLPMFPSPLPPAARVLLKALIVGMANAEIITGVQADCLLELLQIGDA
jgi:hypothetical protein